MFDNTYAQRFEDLAATISQGDVQKARELVEAIANPGSLEQNKRASAPLRRGDLLARRLHVPVLMRGDAATFVASLHGFETNMMLLTDRRRAEPIITFR